MSAFQAIHYGHVGEFILQLFAQWKGVHFQTEGLFPAIAPMDPVYTALLANRGSAGAR